MQQIREEDVAALVRRFQAGETAALGALYETLAPAVRGTIRGYRGAALPPAVSLQDVVQQSWLVVAEVARGWESRGAFLAYFFRTFPRRLARYVRRAERQSQMAAGEVAEAAPAYELVESDWPTELDQLSQPERTAFLLRALERRSFEGIGLELGVSRVAAARLYRRARTTLAARHAVLPADDGLSGLERLVAALHGTAGPGRTIAGRATVLAHTGLGRPAYDRLMRLLVARGVVVDRRGREAGRLALPTVRESLLALHDEPIRLIQ
jgi:RNA polymerase sigma factor (sigma-70 family)